MGFRPDLVACWLFRTGPAGDLEILLIRRATGRLYPGLWQCVTGKLEAGERIVTGALREVVEETGLRSSDFEAFMETDIVNWFHAADLDTLLCEAVFAARIRHHAQVVLSDEHDAFQWLAPEAARELVTWPAYQRAIDTVVWLVANPGRAATFRLPDPA
ncbi:MAG: NUDIX domain-containing protein [Chloroflexi bacterium]|nr:NUDIX domain-containing protein [Chloroflexota bacterium]